MKKTLCLLVLTLLCLAMLLPTAAAANGYDRSTLILDYADLLDDQEEELIADHMQDIIAHHDEQYHFLIITHTHRIEDKITLEQAVPFAIPANTVILTISQNPDGYSYYLFTQGVTQNKLSDADVNVILDDAGVYHNLKSGQTYAGIHSFLDVTDSRLAVFAVKMENLPLILIVSVVTALICCGVVVARYKLKIKPTNYPLDRFAKLKLTEREDIFTGRFVTQRRVSNNSSSGGRSGGGRSGGGRGGR